MTTGGDSGSGSISRFGAFVLDTSRAQLSHHGAEVALRPKTFALLTYMTRRPGRVLGKEELLAAVWPGVVVNDESVSQCVRELRAALNDDRGALIRTVPRRGYLFDPPPADAATTPAHPAPARRRGAWAALAFAAAVLIAGAALVLHGSRDRIEPPVDTRRSIAVLPFGEGASGNSMFGESLAEDLSLDLGRRPGLLVVSIASSAAVAAREADMRRIGRELGVRHLVSGSVQRDGAAVAVSAQLVSTDDGAVRWSGQFRYAGMADWAWQRDIGSAVARALDLPVAAAAAATALDGQRLDAFEATVKGRHQLRRFATLADLRQARTQFEHALTIEPGSARAWVGLARTHLAEVERGWSGDPDTQIAHAERAIARALAVAPEYPPALGLTTGVHAARGDLAAAVAGYQLEVAYQPNSAWGHARLAALKLRLGRPEEVVVHADMALRLSPFEPALVGHSHLWAGIAEFYLEREDAAYERMRRSVAAGLSPTRGVLLWLASLAALQGNEALAAQHAAEVMQLEPGWSISRWRAVTVLTHPRLVAGRERFAEGMKKAGLPD